LQLRANRCQVQRPLATDQIVGLLAIPRVMIVRFVVVHGAIDIVIAHTVR
jgi:hypothetical protein